MPSHTKSKEWLQAFDNIDYEDLSQKRLVDLLAEPIDANEKSRIQNRTSSLLNLVSDLSFEDSIRMNYRFQNPRDPLNLLLTYELSESFANRLRSIAGRKATTGEKLTDVTHRGTSNSGITVAVKKHSSPTSPSKLMQINPPVKPHYLGIHKSYIPRKRTVTLPPAKPKIVYDPSTGNDPFDWIKDNLSEKDVILRISVQQGMVIGGGLYLLSDWLFEEALQIAANLILYKVNSLMTKRVGDAGETMAYCITKQYALHNIPSIINLNDLKTNFTGFDFYDPNNGFISVKTYGALSASKNPQTHIRKKLRYDFDHLFKSDYRNLIVEDIIRSGLTLPVGNSRTEIDRFILNNFKFCVPEDQKVIAMSVFSEYISLNRANFPELTGIAQNSSLFIDTVNEIASRHLITSPITTEEYRHIAEIAKNLDSIKQILISKGRHDLNWYNP